MAPNAAQHQGNKNMIEKRLSYETKKETLPKPKRMEVASKEDYFELLRPVFPKEAIQDLSEDELKALLDHVIDTYYKPKFADGGSADDGDKPKPIDPLALTNLLAAMSDEEKKNLEWMLEKLKVPKK
jgi:hypothetical protein